MKKIYFFVLSCIVLGIAVSSCKKDELYEGLSDRTFRASIDREVKTHLGEDGYKVLWNMNDKVLVASGSRSAIYQVTAIDNNNYATLACGQGQDVQGSSYVAVYPGTSAAYVGGNFRITIPANQTYAANSMVEAPMYGEGTDLNLRFKNLCSVLRLNLKSSGKSVKKICVTSSNKAISGNFDISVSGDDHQVGALTASVATMADAMWITLDCGSAGVNISQSKQFNIYLPVGTYDDFKIKIISTDGLESTFAAESSVEFPRNKVMTIINENVTFSPNKNSTGGLFTVAGASGANAAARRQVYIASGNLWNLVGPTASDAVISQNWVFAEHPYSMYGAYENGQTVWNRFSWSNSSPYDKYGMMVVGMQNQLDNMSGSFVEWGSNIISGDAANTWRTMTFEEWQYLLAPIYWPRRANTRLTDGYMTSGVTRTCDFAYVQAPNGTFSIKLASNDVAHTTLPIQYNGQTFPGIPCLVIYPDDIPLDVFNQVPYDQNNPMTITTTLYNTLVENHCAFLPLLGRGLANGEDTRSGEVFERAYYWTSTSTSNATTAKDISFFRSAGHPDFQFGDISRGNGYGVRLVSNAY